MNIYDQIKFQDIPKDKYNDLISTEYKEKITDGPFDFPGYEVSFRGGWAKPPLKGWMTVKAHDRFFTESEGKIIKRIGR